jgi:hypothetical protein
MPDEDALAGVVAHDLVGAEAVAVLVLVDLHDRLAEGRARAVGAVLLDVERVGDALTGAGRRS